jgi:hypothetical protein
MSVRLFLDGQFTSALHFDARVKVSTDYTNRDIAFNYYTPIEGIPFNKQSENKRTWDIFAANVNYQLKPVLLMAGFDTSNGAPHAATTSSCAVNPTSTAHGRTAAAAYSIRPPRRISVTSSPSAP